MTEESHSKIEATLAAYLSNLKKNPKYFNANIYEREQRIIP
jgi:hypothetical protein